MNPTLQNEIGLADAIFHRRAVRHYRPKPVPAVTVRELLLAAVQAPSALNQQPWVFGIFQGGRRLRAYSERVKQHLVSTYPTSFEVNSRSQRYEDPEYDLFHGASTLIVIYATQGRLNPNEDCCLAAENLMLAAYGMGLGTCPIGYARPWLDLPETKRELGVPEAYTAVFPVVVGFPETLPEPTPREEPIVVSWLSDPVEGE
jgi:nitroreductase